MSAPGFSLTKTERVELVGEVQLVRRDAHAPVRRSAFEPSINATIFIGVVSLANVTAIVVPIAHPFFSATFLSTAIVLILLRSWIDPVTFTKSYTSSIVVGSTANTNLVLPSTCIAPNRMPETLCTSGSALTWWRASGLNPTLFRSHRSSC